MMCYNLKRKIGDFMKLIHYIDDKEISSYKDIDNIYEKNDKKYKFFLDNITNYIYITDRLIFKRESDEYIFTLDISEKPFSKLFLKKENKEFDINVIRASYNINDQIIDIVYELETYDGTHHIVVETGE